MPSVPPADFSCPAAGTPRPVGDPTGETRAEPMVAARPSGRARTLIGVGAPPPAPPDAAPLGRAPRAGDHLGPYQLCVELARKHHPAVVERAVPVIEACADSSRLTEWALAASDLDDSAFLRLVGA